MSTCLCAVDGYCRQHPPAQPVEALRQYMRGVAPIQHDMENGGEDLLLAVIRHLEAGRRRCAFFTTEGTCCHPENPSPEGVEVRS